MKKIILLFIALQWLNEVANSAPSGTAAASGSVSASSSGSFLPFLNFENGNVGVNFGGYSASAGLGGLLTGNAAHGGLQASAGTPYGQKAVAGLAGNVNGEAGMSGGLYAGATAGNGVSAGSGLSGTVDSSGSYSGAKFAGASAGNVGTSVHKTIITEEQPATYKQTYETKQLTDALPEQTATFYKTKYRTRVRSHPHHLRRKFYTYTDYEAPATYVKQEVYVPQKQVTKQVLLTKEVPVEVAPVKAAAVATASVSAGAYGGAYVAPSVHKSVYVEKHKYVQPVVEQKELIVEKPV